MCTSYFHVIQLLKIVRNFKSTFPQLISNSASLFYIVERELPAGQQKFEWNGLDYTGHETASGIYFYKLESENFRAVKKVILLR